MTNEPILREMNLDDWEVYHKIDMEIFPDVLQKEEWFKRRLDSPGFFALDLNGELIGMLILAPYGDDEGHLGRIGVAKSHQGNGYGKLLMKYALEWFKEQGNITTVHLYTQDFNTTAQGLYTKFGFKRIGTTLHYFIPYDSLHPLNKYTCQEILEEEIDPIGARYHEELSAAQIRRFIDKETDMVLTLKNSSEDVVGVARFTPSFPGCMPFLIDSLDCFDDFIAGVRAFSLPEFDYLRLTFTDFPELSKLCTERGYKLHHRLFKMSLTLG